MSEILSLSKARKARAKADRAAAAAENRVRFGRKKAEKARDDAEAERHGRILDGARRDGSADES